MPYTEKQHRTFQAIAHGWEPRKNSLASISRAEASRMAAEGIARKPKKHRKTLRDLATKS